MPLKILKTAVIILIIALMLAACGSTDQMQEHTHRTPNGDLREATDSLDTLPAFLEGQHDAIRSAYQIAALNKDDLDWIPCYCGCGEIAGHKSSKQCFIHEVKEDGSVVWDDHGTRCGVCVQTAVESAIMKREGIPLKEIRDAIDKKYGEGYSDPTPTPMPM